MLSVIESSNWFGGVGLYRGGGVPSNGGDVSFSIKSHELEAELRCRSSKTQLRFINILYVFIFYPSNSPGRSGISNA